MPLLEADVQRASIARRCPASGVETSSATRGIRQRARPRDSWGERLLIPLPDGRGRAAEGSAGEGPPG